MIIIIVLIGLFFWGGVLTCVVYTVLNNTNKGNKIVLIRNRDRCRGRERHEEIEGEL